MCIRDRCGGVHNELQHEARPCFAQEGYLSRGRVRQEVLLAQVFGAAPEGPHGRPTTGVPVEGLQDEVQVGLGEDGAHQGAHWGPALYMPGMQSDVPFCVRLQPSQEEDGAFSEERQEMTDMQEFRIVMIFSY